MAKAAGYLRDYRARRNANYGRPISAAGAALQRRAIDARWRAELDTAGFAGDSLSDILPSGRAPRGMGQEYQDRRWIYQTIATQQKYLRQNERTLQQSRGQRNRQWQDTYNSARVGVLRRLVNDATSFALSDADWGFKREIIAGMVSQMQAQTGAFMR